MSKSFRITIDVEATDLDEAKDLAAELVQLSSAPNYTIYTRFVEELTPLTEQPIPQYQTFGE